MSKKFAILLLTILIYFTACTSDENTYRGRVIELNYSQVEEIKDENWVKIDRWKFVHLRDRKEGATTQFSLPATTIKFDSLDSGKVLQNKIHGRSIPLYLARYLKVINRDSLAGTDEPLYTIVNPAMASVEGKLRIAKTDSGMVQVTVSEDYPAQISVLKK